MYLLTLTMNDLDLGGTFKSDMKAYYVNNF